MIERSILPNDANELWKVLKGVKTLSGEAKTLIRIDCDELSITSADVDETTHWHMYWYLNVNFIDNEVVDDFDYIDTVCNDLTNADQIRQENELKWRIFRNSVGDEVRVEDEVLVRLKLAVRALKSGEPVDQIEKALSSRGWKTKLIRDGLTRGIIFKDSSLEDELMRI